MDQSLKQLALRLFSSELNLEEAQTLLLTEQSAGFRARHPFRTIGNRGFIGGGPEGQGWHVHKPSEHPWSCSTVSPYNYVCSRPDPYVPGRMQIRKLKFDKNKVLGRNQRYRRRSKERTQQIRLGTFDPGSVNPLNYPLVRFKSHFPSGID